MRNLLFLLPLLWLGCAHTAETADTIIHNARIHTMDAAQTVHTAIAIKDGKILEVGPDRQILNKYRSNNKVDGAMRPVYPGLIDAHCHFLGYGMELRNADLVGTGSWPEVLEAVQAHQEAFSGAWVLGRGWDQEDWEVKAFPTNQELNALFPNLPVCLTRVDGHATIVNDTALSLAGIDAEMAAERDDILTNEQGQPTGVLIDNACPLVEDLIPKPNPAEKRQALLRAQQDCFTVGLTTVDDAGLSRADIELIDQLHKSGDLKMRVYAMVSDSPEDLDYYTQVGPQITDRLNVSSFKFYADGSLGSRGACLSRPYADLVHPHYGMILKTPEHYRQAAERLHAAGFQMNTHCIGDSANRVILELYADILGEQNDRRWRIEHAQVVHKQDISVFRDYSIIPSIQPTHATSDMYWAEQRLGRNRVRRAYAYKELREAMGFVALGTDFPVEGISPFNTFYAAVVRKDKENYPEGGFQMENALTRQEALLGMTLWAAMSNHEEAQKGTLEAGKLADLVMLDRDLLACPDDRILGTKVLMTMVDGEVVYQAP